MTGIQWRHGIYTTVPLFVTYLPRDMEDVGSNLGTGRHIVAWVTIYNGAPLSLVDIPSGRLKNLRGLDNTS